MINFGKKGRGRIQGLSNIFGYPLLSQERGKLQISHLASTLRGSIGIKVSDLSVSDLGRVGWPPSHTADGPAGVKNIAGRAVDSELSSRLRE